MRKYLAFFRLRFSMGLQYRAAALSGVITQFAWGVMEILMFRAFYRADAEAFPMTFQATASYVWMQQAFLALFMVWMMENEIFNSITDGNIAYELCRPVDIYNMWFARSLANRLSRAVLRCMPILVVTIFLPAPYGLMRPVSFSAFLLFLLTLFLGLWVTAAFCMLIYMTCFFTISPMGVRMVATSVVEFFSGAVIPLPFFPDGFRQVAALLPFASMQNVPLRIYSGDLAGKEMWQAVSLQIFWLFALTFIGKLLNTLAMKKVTVQGG
ncbi:MAG: ABC transporter permease [Lachnospiraceae bacterium]|nr:ABC transporter permease [Lachnospiraceae bacterium]MBP3459703.1 ABC transporter permease [Lachnospiraceae bacterium]